MAIDPNIILQARGIELPDFGAIQQRADQRKQLQMQMQQQQAQQQRQMTVRDLFAKGSRDGTLDSPEMIGQIGQYDPEMAMQLTTRRQANEQHTWSRTHAENQMAQQRQFHNDDMAVKWANSAAEKAKLAKDKMPGAGQFQAASYAQRIADAEGIMDGLAKENFLGNDRESWASRILPNEARTKQLQKQDQAQRNFINAVLRKESGAAIAETEFASARQQYFPQPGDSIETLEQKRQNRLSVLAGLKAEAGSAYDMMSLEKQRQLMANPTPYSLQPNAPQEKSFAAKLRDGIMPEAKAAGSAPQTMMVDGKRFKKVNGGWELE